MIKNSGGVTVHILKKKVIEKLKCGLMGLKLKKAINQNFTRLTPKKSY
jgi:hypothetical protein